MSMAGTTPNSLLYGQQILRGTYNPEFTPNLNIFNSPPLYGTDMARQMQELLYNRMLNLYRMLGGVS